MNYADHARIKSILLNCGFSYTEEQNDADIIILITCSVRQKAEDKITGLLKDFKKTQKIWITGCMIQHNIRNSKFSQKKIPQNLKIGNFLGTINLDNYEILGLTTNEINKQNNSTKNSKIVPINHAFNPQFFNLKETFENIELFRRIDDTGFLPKILEKIGYKIKYNSDLLNEYEKIIPENQNTSMNIRHKKTAYVPISTGCNQFCSYCIVPYARGLERNFEVEHIVNECKVHLQNGAEEIVLLGQIVNKHPKFVEIIKEVLKLDGLKRLRYTSPYPTYYSNELLELHEKEEKLCPHIHIPFQSGSDQILKAMNRGYNNQKAKEFIDNIKKLDRKISITTDIIVGFPNETDEDFQQSLDLIKYGNFDMIYIGIYSPRPGTYAHKNIPDNIPYEIKHKRWKELNNLLNKISLKNNQKEVGKVKTVLINDFMTKDINGIYKYQGYTDNMKQIIVSSKKKLNIGDFIEVKINRGVVFKLYGEAK
ncbi:MAG: MiaB/RimO family radical SAM methylthiotransferase [Candidatus Absconditabacterales bacterium]|nr:MiaB/RimO family radical SAM methylthiotransferase [Candidatus Absconditabacterales bacterium]